MLESWWELVKHGIRKAKFQNAEACKKKEKSNKDCKKLFGPKRETRMLQNSVQGMPYNNNNKGWQEEGSILIKSFFENFSLWKG